MFRVDRRKIFLGWRFHVSMFFMVGWWNVILAWWQIASIRMLLFLLWRKILILRWFIGIRFFVSIWVAFFRWEIIVIRGLVGGFWRLIILQLLLDMLINWWGQVGFRGWDVVKRNAWRRLFWRWQIILSRGEVGARQLLNIIHCSIRINKMINFLCFMHGSQI